VKMKLSLKEALEAPPGDCTPRGGSVNPGSGCSANEETAAVIAKKVL